MHKVDREGVPLWEGRSMASFLGIDLSKETFHAFLLSDRADAKRVFPNTPKGFEQLTTWLKNRHADEVHSAWRRPARIGNRWRCTSMASSSTSASLIRLASR